MASYLEPAKGGAVSREYDGKSPGEYWHAQIESAQKSQQTYVEKAKKVVKRFRDERDAIESQRKKFNILWSNYQVLFPALYGREPKPDVTRRYMDDDPPSRLASMILERAIEYEVENFDDFDAAMRGAVEDRLLPGRGISWVRYEPNIVQVEPQASPEAEVAEEGAQITEDTEQPENTEPAERVVSAHSPCDYVFWQDFMHSPARTWEEVWWVGRWVYMTKEEGLERFGAVFKNVPCEQQETETTWRRGDSKAVRAEMEKKAKVAEIWNKRTGKVCWVAKGYPQALDEREDFLKLDGFFPCPKPLFATMTTGSLIPVPDYLEYQDQASELDELQNRIWMLTKACKVVGAFNAEFKELQRMLNEGIDNRLFPVDAWAAFAEKGGVKGAVELLDISTIVTVIGTLQERFEAAKQGIYEIMGISDIIRGATKATETLGAQQLKANFGSLRLKSSQMEVARYASDLFRIKAQIICRFYPPEVLVKMSGVEHTEDGKNQELLAAAMQLLKSETAREFSIQVTSDTLAQIDEQQEKQQAMEFTQALGSYFKDAVPLLQAAPYMANMVGEVLLFNVRRFHAGRPVEASIEQAMKQMNQAVQQAMSQQKPDPEVQKAQAEAQKEAAITARQAQEAQAQEAEKNRQAALERANHEAELAREDAFERWKVEQDSRTRIEVAEIQAGAVLDAAEIRAANAGAAGDASGAPDGAQPQAPGAKPRGKSPLKALREQQAQHQEQMQQHAQNLVHAHEQLAATVAQHMQNMQAQAQAPVRFHRGQDGKVTHVQKGNQVIPVARDAQGLVAGLGNGTLQ